MTKQPGWSKRFARLSCEALEDRVTPATAYALSGTNLLAFDTASPTNTATIALTGIAAGETLVGIDVRAQNGQLYGLGVNATADTATLYAISVRTGLATPVSAMSGAVTFTTDGTTAVDLPDPATTGYGIDFNPAADRFRVVAGSLNFRVNPNTGLGVDGDNTGLTTGTVTGTNPDGPINGATTTVDATAYTNNMPNNGNLTTQYTLDAASNMLFIQTPPNTGTQVNPGGTPITITLGGNPLDFTAVNGFDIPAGVNVTTSGQPVTAGSGFAVLNVGGTTGLYSINLLTGVATLVGTVGTGTTPVQGLAVTNDLGGFPAVALSGDGTQLIRFNTGTAATVTTVAISGLAANERLVGIDFRPQTGQLIGLAINVTATPNNGTLYLIDPQTGAATPLVAGTVGAITFVDATNNPVAFADPATAGYGLDFNPTVDRLRVTTSTGQNFRVNPLTGLGVDGNATPAGTQMDTAISGLPSGSTGVSSTAYTNSFGQPLTGGTTTQYTLDAASNTLLIQGAVAPPGPNGGVQTNLLPVTVGGAPLDFTEVTGFDIPAGVRVSPSGTAAAAGSRGFATLVVGGVTNLYSIDLATGAATLVGAVGAGTTPLAGFALADAPAGTINFSAANFSAVENAGTLTVTATRTGGTNGAVTVTAMVTGGTAVAGTDFVGTTFALTFADGATTASTTIPITDNMAAGGNKSITLALMNPTNGAVLGATATATAFVLDNEAPPLAPTTAFALSGTNLLTFDAANPGAVTTTPLVGLATGDVLVGIDVRPQNGFLYALAVNPATGTERATLYAVSVRTGVLTPVGTGATFTTDGTTPVDLPDPAAVGYGLDFNPTVDRLRVVAGSLNFRINPNTGAGIDGNNGGAVVAGTNPDGAINGPTTTVDAVAYTNSQQNATVTTQYTLDATTDRLFIQNPPNSGTQANPGGTARPITLGGAPLDFTAVSGFDIPAGVNVAVSGNAAVVGSGFAVLTVGGVPRLYRIDLATGAATLVGTVGTGAAPVSGLALNNDFGGVPTIGVNAAGTQLLRFNTGTPDTTAAVTIPAPGMTGGPATGEVLVGLDYRPATGQLYALAVNETANTATLYLVDPQPGTGPVLTAVGPLGGITFMTTGGMAVDLPPAAAGYGFDFNPTVDRIRVTTGTGLNFRINPNDGAAVDTNAMAAGNQTDANINGLGVTGISAVAYTNSFGTGGNPTLPAGTTSQYTLDAASDTLFIQTTPNSGTQTNPLPVTLGGAALNFDAVSGFDIPGGVRVTTSGTAVTSGFGFAVLTVGGTPGLYRIDLATGAATLIGATTAATGLAVGDAPVGAVSFTGATFTASEGGTNAMVTLTRTGGSTGAVTVTVTVTGGTAVAGTDFTGGPFTVTFGDGQTTATLLIPVTDNTVVGPAKTVILALSAPTNGAVLGAQGTATLNITDDEATVSAAGGGTVRVLDGNGALVRTVTPFPGFTGDVTVATADLNGDGTDDVIAGASAGGHVKVLDGATGAELRSFFAFQGFNGAVSVGSADVNNDGVADMIVGAPINGHVKAFDGATGAELRSFFAFQGFSGAVTVSGGDVNGDGVDDMIVGAAVNGHVKAFSGSDGSVLQSFLAFAGFSGPVAVAGGDVNGDGIADLIVGAGPGAPGGHVKAFSGADGSQIRSFLAFPGFLGGVRVGADDQNNDGVADIVVGAGPGGPGGRVTAFDGQTLAILSNFFAFPDTFVGGVFVD